MEFYYAGADIADPTSRHLNNFNKAIVLVVRRSFKSGDELCLKLILPNMRALSRTEYSERSSRY